MILLTVAALAAMLLIPGTPGYVHALVGVVWVCGWALLRARRTG